MNDLELHDGGYPNTLSAEQVADFEERGYLRLREAFPRAAALEMQERMWSELRGQFGIDRDDRSTWYQPARSLRAAKWDPLQRATETASLVGAIKGLLGPTVRWKLPTNWGVVLVTFPNRVGGEWTVPMSGWHYDFDLHENAMSARGLLVFTFFSTVAPRGGGTAIVEGSHRLLRRFHESLAPDEQRSDHRRLRKRFLRHDPWLRTLTTVGSAAKERIDELMREGHRVGGVPVRVSELTGEPGDAILCHPLMLHVGSRNVLDFPRFMRSQRICGESSGQPALPTSTSRRETEWPNSG